ncbi:MAG: response regulator [Candidatus Cloacimonadota bacterium]|nr:response regulator [Candidatus Cloacimonadota bacterium]
MEKQKSILIVEDEVILSAWLKMQLEDEGYLVCGRFATGEKAIEFVKETKPDVILMDIHLVGKIDGIEAAEQILETSNIPIIFMTGYENKQVAERAQKINPVAFLIKPVEIWDLKPVFESLFS